ncbi:MAG: ABC transporter substrate-binding protein [Bacteroidales bacterium]|nr:ABC transporter substrate-binding protein [Bacteroidales bacterium]
MKRVYLIVSLGLCLVLAYSCKKEKYREITDQKERVVQLKQDNYNKVVCLSSSMGEWMYKLGLQDKIVGRNSLCNYPEDMLQKPDVGMAYLLDTNIIKTLQPDLVLAETHIPKKWLDWLEEKGISTVLFRGGNKVSDIYPAITLLGEVFNKQSEVENIIKEYKKEIAEIEAKPLKPSPRVYFAMRFAGYGGEDITATKDHLFGDIMRIAGVNNIAKNYKSKSVVRADIVREDPEYIFVYSKAKEEFLSKPVYQNMSALKNNKVIGIDKDMLLELSPRNLDAIKFIRNTIQSYEEN